MSDKFENFIVQFRAAIPGSPAAKAGMKKGDIILSVNGVPTPTFTDYIAATENRTNFQKMDVLRDNEVIEITLTWDDTKEPDYESVVQYLKDADIIPQESETPEAKKVLN